MARRGDAGEPPSFVHLPVLCREAVEVLRPTPGATAVDATVGGGGHAEALLHAVAPGGRLLGMDRDPAACAATEERLRPQALERGVDLRIVHGNYASLEEVFSGTGWVGADAILFDLGVSSPQFDTAERGFSFRADAPLDMRMDPTQGTTAYHLVNGLSEGELEALIRRFGEERWARRIAAFIVARRRESGLISTTGELVDVIRAAVPAGARRHGPHPARRTFQALRIAVNNELGHLEAGLRAAVRCLRPGGRLAAISFHSLEDRTVKQVLRGLEGACSCPPDWPVCRCGAEALVRNLTRRPVAPSEEEVASNPRARSAKLRAAVRLDYAAGPGAVADDVVGPPGPADPPPARAARRPRRGPGLAAGVPSLAQTLGYGPGGGPVLHAERGQ